MIINKNNNTEVNILNNKSKQSQKSIYIRPNISKQKKSYNYKLVDKTNIPKDKQKLTLDGIINNSLNETKENSFQKNIQYKIITNIDSINSGVSEQKIYLINNNILLNDNNKPLIKKKAQSLQKKYFENKINLKNTGFEKIKSKNNEKLPNSVEKVIINENQLKNINNEIRPKGLYNFGLNCYMNSLLQCFFYIKELREYFIENKDVFNEEQQPVCKAFAEVMYGLKNNEKECYEPKKFKQLIGDKNSLFYGCKAADVKDLFFNLIDALLTELTEEKESNISEKLSLDYSNILQMFEESKKEIEKHNNIINKLFIGYYYTMYNCLESKINTYSFQTESFILFELEKIKHFFNDKNLSIDLCFKYYFRNQPNSSFYCNNCKKTHIGEAYDKIYRPPKILVVILDRGHGKIFSEELKIK